MTVKHPAKFSDTIIELLNREVPAGKICDPFAGTGKVHLLANDKRDTYGVEIEPEWASMHPRTIVGNALLLPFPNETFDCIVTSPTYGNRLADHHKAQDGSIRHSYTHDLGRTLHPDNSGTTYFWQSGYRAFHLKAWMEAFRILKVGGEAYINVSNFIRGGMEQDVVGMHAELLAMAGGRIVKIHHVDTPRLRFGANGDARVGEETILLFYKQQRP